MTTKTFDLTLVQEGAKTDLESARRLFDAAVALAEQLKKLPPEDQMAASGPLNEVIDSAERLTRQGAKLGDALSRLVT